MTKIIGHRGAPGIALENSAASFKAALEAKVDIIELDVRLTADDQLVVLHDTRTTRVAVESVAVRDKTLRELQSLKLRNGERLLSLDQALDIIGSHPVMVELKDNGCVDELLLVLGRHPKAHIIVSSFFHDELEQLRRVAPDIPRYVAEHFAPVAIIQHARHLHADGIALNKWLMNPLTYRLAKRYQLELAVYTVNSSLISRFLLKLYPDIYFYTDHPDRFIDPKSRRSLKDHVA